MIFTNLHPKINFSTVGQPNLSFPSTAGTERIRLRYGQKNLPSPWKFLAVSFLTPPPLKKCVKTYDCFIAILATKHSLVFGYFRPVFVSFFPKKPSIFRQSDGDATCWPKSSKKICSRQQCKQFQLAPKSIRFWDLQC